MFGFNCNCNRFARNDSLHETHTRHNGHMLEAMGLDSITFYNEYLWDGSSAIENLSEDGADPKTGWVISGDRHVHRGFIGSGVRSSAGDRAWDLAIWPKPDRPSVLHIFETNNENVLIFMVWLSGLWAYNRDPLILCMFSNLVIVCWPIRIGLIGKL